MGCYDFSKLSFYDIKLRADIFSFDSTDNPKTYISIEIFPFK